MLPPPHSPTAWRPGLRSESTKEPWPKQPDGSWRYATLRTASPQPRRSQTTSLRRMSFSPSRAGIARYPTLRPAAVARHCPSPRRVPRPSVAAALGRNDDTARTSWERRWSASRVEAVGRRTRRLPRTAGAARVAAAVAKHRRHRRPEHADFPPEPVVHGPFASPGASIPATHSPFTGTALQTSWLDASPDARDDARHRETQDAERNVLGISERADARDLRLYRVFGPANARARVPSRAPHRDRGRGHAGADADDCAWSRPSACADGRECARGGENACRLLIVSCPAMMATSAGAGDRSVHIRNRFRHGG